MPLLISYHLLVDVEAGLQQLREARQPTARTPIARAVAPLSGNLSEKGGRKRVESRSRGSARCRVVAVAADGRQICPQQSGSGLGSRGGAVVTVGGDLAQLDLLLQRDAEEHSRGGASKRAQPRREPLLLNAPLFAPRVLTILST